MNVDKERMRQAYIDGALSASEISTFESKLTPVEKDRLALEIQFEFALADALGAGGNCPDDVWQRTRQKLAQRRPSQARRWNGRRTTAAILTTGALAAAAIAVFVINQPTEEPETPGDSAQIASAPIDPAPAITLGATTLEELAALSTIAPGEESAEAFLKENGVNLDVAPLTSLSIARVHHHLEVLGARKDMIGNSPVFELLIACCGYPEKVVVAEQGTPAADEIGRAAGGQGQVQATRTIGKYIAAVVGDHQAHGLLDMFSVAVAANAGLSLAIQAL